MYSQLLTSTVNIQMVEYLMAGMWILVKDPDNRKALMASAEAVPGMFGSMAKQLKDVADVADVHQEVGRGGWPVDLSVADWWPCDVMWSSCHSSTHTAAQHPGAAAGCAMCPPEAIRDSCSLWCPLCVDSEPLSAVVGASGALGCSMV